MAPATKTPKPRIGSRYHTTFTLHPTSSSPKSCSKFSAPLLCIYTTYHSTVYLSPPLRLIPFLPPVTRLLSNRPTHPLDFRGRKLIVKSILHPDLYTNEVEAYGRLVDLQGSTIPRLHGQVKGIGKETMILGIEYIEGEVLDLDIVERYGRENVKMGLVRVYDELTKRGVYPGDAQARHVLICPVRGLTYWGKLWRVLQDGRKGNLLVRKMKMRGWTAVGACIVILLVGALFWRWAWMLSLAIFLWIVPSNIAEIVIIDFSHAEFDCQDSGRNIADAKSIIDDVYRWT